MDYNKRYSLNAIEARTDGSATVAHAITAEAQNTVGGDWFTIPGRNMTILVPAVDLSAILAVGTTGAKVAAYKALLVANLGNRYADPVTGWGLDALEDLLDGNDLSTEAKAAADNFITMTLGLALPVTFTI